MVSVNFTNAEMIGFIKKLIQLYPEAAEPKRGRWKSAGMGDYMCSRCAEWVSGNRYHYCPNCGAKMYEEDQ